MKWKEIKEKERSELLKLLREQKELLRKLRYDLATDKLKNVREIRKTKKTIARILTCLKQKYDKIT